MMARLFMEEFGEDLVGVSFFFNQVELCAVPKGVYSSSGTSWTYYFSITLFPEGFIFLEEIKVLHFCLLD